MKSGRALDWSAISATCAYSCHKRPSTVADPCASRVVERLGPLHRAWRPPRAPDSGMPPLYLTYLNALDVEALALADDEILNAIEAGLAAQGRKETVIEPRMHLMPDAGSNGHFNVLRGAFKAPLDLAGVKVIGDFVDNYRDGLPSEMGLLFLMDPHNGVPKAIIDGSHLTDMRTGAVTAIGAKYLARKDAQ